MTTGGSGLGPLVNAFHAPRADGFALWDALSFVSVGSEPPAEAVHSMAAALVSAYASDWPVEAKETITPAALVAALAPPARRRLTSARPALLAHALGHMGDGRRDAPEQVMGQAEGSSFAQTGPTFMRDAAVAVAALDQAQRRVLLAVATGGYTCGELAAIKSGRGRARFREDAGCMPLPERFAALIDCLREAGSGDDVLRLQPPYASLIASWVCENGDLAVGFNDDLVDLNAHTRGNLAFIAAPAQRRQVGAPLQAAVSSAVLAALARHGVGVVQTDGSVRPPATAAELDAVPELHGLRGTLACSRLPGIDHREPSLSKILQPAAAAEGDRAALPLAAAAEGRLAPTAAHAAVTMGWELLQALHHISPYSWMYQPVVRSDDLAATAAVDAVRAAAAILTEPHGGCFAFDPTDAELLISRP